MRSQAHKLILLTIMLVIYISSACERQRATASVTQQITSSLPTQSAVPATSHALSTPISPTSTHSVTVQIGKIIPIDNGFPFGLGFAKQSLWILKRSGSFYSPPSWTSGSILRIDPVSGEIIDEPIQIDFDPWSFAVTEDSIWVGKNGHQKLLRLDPTTGQVITTIGVDACLVAANQNGAWVTGTFPETNTVLHIDPVNNQVIGKPIPVGPEPTQLVAGAGAIWVSSHSGPPPVTRIDPTTGKVVATIEVGFPVHGLAAGPDSVWVIDYHGYKVLRISPETNQVIGWPITLDFPPYAGAVSGTDAWVGVSAFGNEAARTDDRIVRIDLRTNTIVDTIHVGGRPVAMLFADSSLWVATVDPNLVVEVVPQSLTPPAP